jgi:hypothetical protein
VGINTNTPYTNALTLGGAGLQIGGIGTPIARLEAGTATLGSGIAGVNRFTVTLPSAFVAAPKVNVTVRYGSNDVNDTYAVTLRLVTWGSINVERIAGGRMRFRLTELESFDRRSSRCNASS